MSSIYLTDFARELHDLIDRHVEQDIPAEDLVEEMTRQLNSVFGKYNVEYRVFRREAA